MFIVINTIDAKRLGFSAVDFESTALVGVYGREVVCHDCQFDNDYIMLGCLTKAGMNEHFGNSLAAPFRFYVDADDRCTVVILF